MVACSLSIMFVAVLSAMTATVAASAVCGGDQSCATEDAPQPQVGRMMLQAVINKHASVVGDANMKDTLSSESELGSLTLMARVDGLEKEVASLEERASSMEGKVLGSGNADAPTWSSAAQTNAYESQSDDSSSPSNGVPSQLPHGRASDDSQLNGPPWSIGTASQLPQAAVWAPPQGLSGLQDDVEQAHDNGSQSNDAPLQGAGSENVRARPEHVSALQEAARDNAKNVMEFLKSRVASLESDVAVVKSKLTSLEKEVSGEDTSLSQKDSGLLPAQAANSSLKIRIASLEDEVDHCKNRMTILEQKVSG